MWVFGEKAIPPNLRESGEYKPYVITLGRESSWGPLSMDIKPIFYIYQRDYHHTRHTFEDWFEQCVAHMMVCLQDHIYEMSPCDMDEIYEEMEYHICMVMCYPMKEVEI